MRKLMRTDTCVSGTWMAARIKSKIPGSLSEYGETLKIASIDWCPQICPGQTKAGYVTDTVKKVFEGGPYQLSIKQYPWSRAILLVRTGKAHALLAPAKAEAPDLVFPVNEIGEMVGYFDREMSNLKKSGQIQEIMSRYGLEDGQKVMK